MNCTRSPTERVQTLLSLSGAMMDRKRTSFLFKARRSCKSSYLKVLNLSGEERTIVKINLKINSSMHVNWLWSFST